MGKSAKRKKVNDRKFFNLELSETEVINRLLKVAQKSQSKKVEPIQNRFEELDGNVNMQSDLYKANNEPNEMDIWIEDILDKYSEEEINTVLERLNLDSLNEVFIQGHVDIFKELIKEL